MRSNLSQVHRQPSTEATDMTTHPPRPWPHLSKAQWIGFRTSLDGLADTWSAYFRTLADREIARIEGCAHRRRRRRSVRRSCRATTRRRIRRRLRCTSTRPDGRVRRGPVIGNCGSGAERIESVTHIYRSNYQGPAPGLEDATCNLAPDNVSCHSQKGASMAEIERLFTMSSKRQ